MFVPRGYTLLRELGSRRAGPRSCVARRQLDGREVVLRVYEPARDARSASDRARRQLDALRACAGPGVPQAIDVIDGGSRVVLIRSYVPGISLDTWARERLPGLDELLCLAGQLAEILARVHAAGLVHCGLTPGSICVDRAPLRAHLVSFERALAVESAAGGAGDARAALGSDVDLRYIAPEQTGRMDLGVDARSDLYALGAVLFFAATGRPPFDGSDALSLIHAHMARVPTAPAELRPEIGSAFSRVVMKLLVKQPEGRYPSAARLLDDLRRCSEELAAHGVLHDDLRIACPELPDKPGFSRELYDRDPERDVLERALVRAAAGHLQAVLVRGGPGSGKSSLVESMRSTVEHRGGQLAKGSFDEYRDRPYLGWVRALTSLAEQLLLEPDERLDRWRRDLSAAVGSIAGALTECAPELRFILPDAPPVPPVGPRESRSRLALAMSRLLEACATRDHPLVLFLDDVQWSDSGSRFILRDLLARSAPIALLLVGSYRADEQSLDADLAALFTEPSVPPRAPLVIDLGPLSQRGCALMLADALARRPDDTFPLAQIVRRKTDGSPLLIQQLIHHVHEHGWLRFRPDAGWTWSLEEIECAEVPDGAVGLLIARVDRLGDGPRELLALASCIQEETDPALLAAVSGQTDAVLQANLEALADAGLIVQSERGIRIAHDRFREAGRALLSEADRKRAHCTIGCAMLERLPRDEWPSRALELADSLNLGLEHLPSELRVTAIEVNLLAARQAFRAGVAAVANPYLDTARKLLDPADWTCRRTTVFELYLRSAESRFHANAPEEALMLLDALEQRSPSRMELAQIAVGRVQVYALTRPPEECVRYVLAVLRRLGVRWPLRPSQLRLKAQLLRVRWLLRWHGGADTIRPATQFTSRWIPAFIVQGAAASTIVRYDYRLSVLITAFVMRFNLREGYLARPGFSLAAFAMYSHLVLGNARDAAALARDALRLEERAPDPLYGPRARFLVHGLLNPWLMPRRQALASLTSVFEQIRETGDTEYAYYCRFVYAMNLGLAGDPLRPTEERLRELESEVARTTHVYPAPSRCLEAFVVLGADSPSDLAPLLADCEPRLVADTSGEPWARTAWMLVLVVLNRCDLAFAQSEAIGERLLRVSPFVHVADHQLLRGIAAAELARGAGRQRRTFVRALDRCRRRMRTWARGGPDFEHMATFLEAEQACLRGDDRRAHQLYFRSARRAAKQAFTHHAALAHERCARMSSRARRYTEAEQSLGEALTCYREWGAIAKIRALEKEREELLRS